MKMASDKRRHSTILKKLMRMTENFYTLLTHGFFGKLFSSYSEEEKLLEESGLFRRFRAVKKPEQLAGALKLSMASSFENSVFFEMAERVTASFIYRKLKTFGALLLSLGGYGVIVGIIQGMAFSHATVDARHLFVCGTMVFVALPLLSSKETLAEALLQSKLLSPILFDGLGFSRDAFTKKTVFPNRYALVTAIGMILGVLTVFIDPLYYVAAAVIVISTLVIFRFPEVGVVCWVALIPLVGVFERSSLILFALVFITGASYLVKLILGKRSFRMKLIDYPVLLFSVIYLFSGIFSEGGPGSFRSAVMYVVLLSGYFSIVNLMRTHLWIKRCVTAGVCSGTLACLVGMVQIFTGTMNASWIDVERFSNIGTRIVSTFGNPNIFAEYLLLLLPFTVVFLLKKGSVRYKVLCGFSLFVMLTCLVFTWSRGAWLGFLFGAFLFFIILSKKFFLAFLGLFCAAPVLSWLIPRAVTDRFLSIGNLAESSASYRISAWHGVLELLNDTWWCGIGVGNAAFEAVYPGVALAGVETIEHAHSIYLQLLAELGIPGLFVFLLIIFLFVQRCFEYLYKVRNGEERGFVIAGIAAVGAILVMGVTDHIWYSFPIFLAFWTVVALVCAAIQCDLFEQERYKDYENNTQYASVIEIGTEPLL